MKKITIICFFFLSLITCYFVYKLTEKSEIHVTIIGDEIAKKMYINKKESNVIYDKEYTNKNYRIIDILNILKYNQEKEIDGKAKSLHQILKNTDVLIVSIGMNDIYFKINNSTQEMYTNINDMINNYEKVLKIINKYDYKNIFILGYYNINNKYNSAYEYANYKLKKISHENNCIYIDLYSIFKDKPEYLQESNSFYPNNLGYSKIIELIVEKMK